MIKTELHNFLNEREKEKKEREETRKTKDINNYTIFDLADMLIEYVDWRIQENDDSIQKSKELNEMKADITKLLKKVFPEEKGDKKIIYS